MLPCQGYVADEAGCKHVLVDATEVKVVSP